MINKTKFIDYVSNLSNSTNFKKWIANKATSLGLSGGFLSIIKQIFLHDFFNSSSIPIGYNSSFTLYDVLFGDYVTVKSINDEMILIVGITNINKLVPADLKSALLNVFTNKYKRPNSEMLLDSFDTVTCEYCQIQFTYGVYSTKKKTMVANVDHIIPKASNNLFSFSYGNLLISCPSCNSTFKGKGGSIIYDRLKVCPSELFKLVVSYNGLKGISSRKLLKHEFKILVDKSSVYYLDYLLLEDRVNNFKDYLAEFIYNYYGISSMFKINAVLWSTGLLNEQLGKRVQGLLVNQYNSFYNNQMGQILKSVKLAIQKDLQNHTYILVASL